MSNPYAKTRSVENPWAIYVGPNGFEWRILKTYKKPENEAEDPYARWFVAAKSNMTYGRWEYGDTYCRDIKTYGRCIVPFPSTLEA